MSAIAAVLILVLAATSATLAVLLWQRTRRDILGAPVLPSGADRILFPYGRRGPTPRALNTALRLASAEDATLVPVFLARVSLHLPLDAPLPRTAKIIVPLQEVIDRRAAAAGVKVEQRIERGRSYRHAMHEMIAHERFDRIVIAASDGPGRGGFDADDIAWMLRNAPGEIVVLRTARDAASASGSGSGAGAQGGGSEVSPPRP